MSEQMAQTGFTTNDRLSWVDLPPGMGSAQPISGSPHSYTGTVILGPDDGFNFHLHPHQKEVIFVYEGRMEGWVEKEKSILGPGDVMIAPAGVVHACFNASNKPVKLLIVLDPLIPDVEEDMELVEGFGWEMIMVSEEAPWNSLR